MAIQGVRPIDSPPRGITPELLQNFALRRATVDQARFDQARAAEAKQMAETGQLEYVDPVAREEALARQEQRYQRIFDRYKGNLAAGLGDVQQAVAQNVSDPWANINKYQVEQLKQENELKARFGDQAIVRSNVAGQRLAGAIDPETGQILDSNINQRLTADVRQADDYAKFVANTFSKMRADVQAGRLKAAPGLQHILERYSVEELPEDKIREFVNDPAFRQAFMQSTTAGIDNRQNVGFDPQSNTNIFQRGASDERFADGIAQFAYGVLANRAYRASRVQQLQDPLAVFDAKQRARGRGAGTEKPPALPTMPTKRALPEVTETKGAMEQLFEDQEFDKEGKLKAFEVDFPGLGAAQRLIGAKPELKTVEGEVGPITEKPDPNEDIVRYESDEYKKAVKQIESFKKTFELPDTTTQKAVADIMVNTEKAHKAYSNTLINYGGGYNKVKEAQLQRDLPTRNVEVGGKTYSLINNEQRREFTEALGYGDGSGAWDEFKKRNPNYGVAGVKALPTPGVQDNLRGFPIVTVLNDANGEPVQVNVQNEEEFTKVGEPLQQLRLGELEGKKSKTTPIYDYVQDPKTGTLTTQPVGRATAIYRPVRDAQGQMRMQTQVVQHPAKLDLYTVSQDAEGKTVATKFQTVDMNNKDAAKNIEALVDFATQKAQEKGTTPAQELQEMTLGKMVVSNFEDFTTATEERVRKASQLWVDSKGAVKSAKQQGNPTR